MYPSQLKWRSQLEEIKNQGLYKNEYLLESAQGGVIQVAEKQVLNFCANNYLGLSNHPEIVEAAKKGLEKWGLGLSSVRFICGTQSIHKELERKLSDFLGKEDTILYSSCFDANGGLFETLLGREDAIISDTLNHASIIDGVRLCKAQRFTYTHGDMNELEQHLVQSRDCPVRLITTDGVFSMDGAIAKLKDIVYLAKKYQALLHVDDSHATGVIGEAGKGSGEYRGVLDQIDIITSTLGKALGGASGGFTSGHQEIIDLLRQRSRTYLFSNSLAPAIVSSSIAVLDRLRNDPTMLQKLGQNTLYFREKISKLGLTVGEGVHPIVPIMLGEARLAQEMAEKLLNENIYVIGFSYPVVPKDQARIRVQISAAHSREDLDRAIEAFAKIGKSLQLI